MSEKQPRGWDKISDGISTEKQVMAEQKTIIISQPSARPSVISNTEPLTDEYLDLILPSVGYKIVPIPKRFQKQQSERVILQEVESNSGRIPAEFQKLYTDTRPDEELTPDEQHERFAMKLLMQIKDGTVYQRKMGIRLLTNYAPTLGAELIFSKFIPLIQSTVLTELERHTLIKTLDRLMYRLSNSILQYIPDLLKFVGPMLIDKEPVTRAEGREVTSNLAKIAGMPIILKTLRPNLESEDEDIRSITSQILATTATSIGIPQIFPLLRAMLSSKKSWYCKHTAIRTIDQICFQNRNGILPHLSVLIGMILPCLDDEEEPVQRQAIKCVRAMADAAAPYGGKMFEKVTEKILQGLQTKMHKFCLNAMSSLMLTMEQSVCALYFHRLFMKLGHSFESQDLKEKIAGLALFENSLIKDAVQIDELRALYDPFFRGYWNQRSTLNKSLTTKIIKVTTMIAQRSSLSETIFSMFGDFKVMSDDYKCCVMQCLRDIIRNLSLKNLTNSDMTQICENILFGYDNVDDEKIKSIFYKGIEEFLANSDDRIGSILEYVTDQINQKINMPNAKTREKGAKILTLFAETFDKCNVRPPLIHFYEVTQEMFIEEYPNVLSAVLSGCGKCCQYLKVEEMRTKPDDVIPKLVPVLKNRNEEVAYSCVNLINNLLQKSSNDDRQNREWMRICFELLELLKSDKRKVRDSAINCFSNIAKKISPFDVLLALLNNLRVQDRQIRLCTTIAISALAENVGPHIVLPALMNEYRTPDMNVQNGALKALSYLFHDIGKEVSDYCYAITPLLVYSLIERDDIHRQQSCNAVTSFTVGLYCQGKEDCLLHILNHLIPNVFESGMHFIEAFMNAMDAMRLSLGPGLILNHCLAGLFHPARKVRSQFWRIYNNLIIYSGGELVPFYPIMKSTEKNNYHRDDYDVFV
ncbi:splicing factor subunit, putative [Trichomonas vaginalis G3]|uniref:Splicing factor subunit, putative n=1 Tax=Trichomonas vaginalis (strain ATCC PRA-98 / G3) TaxID=412133 RepID=A2FAC5_TRIV3|nr:splicing factor 3B, subunit 1-related family [Trichomonas vaginalis G3]EAX98142.1 splicing factor subunit, putative [Trichomonas vaginalis G3]KAI5484858.1 splicing factor 3B, subunit 1-related family [Trichomonas vaginalis G3]|eukprot:XP_001311072.1 splicing factor subunit [Trichomonas vaginalis G3]